MSGFVDPTDTVAVEAVLARALASLGIDNLVGQLAAVPDLEVRPGRRGGLLKAASPAVVGHGDRRLVLADPPVMEHVVGGVVLARDRVSRTALAGTLGALVCRAVADSGAADDVSVLLTSLRDAVEI